MGKQPVASGLAAVAIYIFRFYVKPILFAPFFRNFCPQLIIIVLCGNMSRAFITKQSAIGYHFSHDSFLFIWMMKIWSFWVRPET
jgi:hypothetical protein